MPTGGRQPLIVRRAAVATSQPLATEAGLRILRAGGNAVDAAVAIAAALAVLEPCSNGIGGDAFMLYYDSLERRVHGLNASGRYPSKGSLDDVRAALGKATTASSMAAHKAYATRSGHELPGTEPLWGEKDTPDAFCSARTVTVPGAVRGWDDALKNWGSLGFAEVLAPAIEYAEEGFPVAPITAAAWKQQEALLQAQQQRVNAWQRRKAGGQPELHSSCPLLNARGQAPKAGEVFRNPSLAQTLRRIVLHGADGYYSGEVAQAIAQTVQGLGGQLSEKDLAEHCSDLVDPICAEVFGNNVWEIPPNGQGAVALEALKICERLGVAELDREQPQFWHLVIDAVRMSFSDARRFGLSDPAKSGTDASQRMLSEENIAKRVSEFDKSKKWTGSGAAPRASGTVSFQVVDEDGNAVSMVQSNYLGFGSGICPPGLGFVLQNRGANFDLSPTSANCLAPGKRPYHTIIPCLVTNARSGQLTATLTNMGGHMQPCGHTLHVIGLLCQRMDPQRCVDVPRFCLDSADRVLLEEGHSRFISRELQALGHTVTDAPTATYGRAQIIQKRNCQSCSACLSNAACRQPVLWAGSDWRADGCAGGY